MKLLYEDLSNSIINSAIEVHKNLGSGFLEKVYEKALIYELNQKNIKIDIQKSIDVHYKNIVIGKFTPDLIVDDKIIIELKALSTIESTHISQVLNYLKATNMEVGILLNFGRERLEIKRVIETRK